MINHAHAKPGLGRFADALADPAEADDAERTAEDVAAGEAGAGVVVICGDGGGHPREVLRDADHHREDVLDDTLRVRPRRVNHLDSALGGRLDIDGVVANPVAADDLQVLAAIHRGGVDDPAGADDKGIGVDDLAPDGLRVGSRGHPKVAGLAEHLDSRFAHRGERQDDGTVGVGHGSTNLSTAHNVVIHGCRPN